jgi:hypothetical protein
LEPLERTNGASIVFGLFALLNQVHESTIKDWMGETPSSLEHTSSPKIYVGSIALHFHKSKQAILIEVLVLTFHTFVIIALFQT